jgi:hypothetical protein
MDHCCDCDCNGSLLEGFQTQFSLPVAHALCSCCICYYWMFPIALCLFLFLLQLPLCLIVIAPPLTIILSAFPCLRSNEYKVFENFDPSKERADPSELGLILNLIEL